MSAVVAGEWVEVSFRVPKEAAGKRLDAFLAARLHKYSRSTVKRLIRDKRVYRAGKEAKAAAKLSADETVIVRYPKVEEPPVPHEVMPVLHQDQRIVVISKPAGTLSHPTDKVTHNTVTHLLAKQIERKLYLPHRLDRETSGVMILALVPDAARELHRQFLARTIAKEYLAVALGAPEWDETTVDAPIGAEGKEIKVRRAVGAEDGQAAVTEFRVLKREGRFSLIAAKPRTGRLHQIRAHLAHLGHPVAGDKLYIGAGEAYMKAVRKEVRPEDLDALGAARQLLHAWRLSFDHPDDGRRVEIVAPVPEDFPLKP